MFDDFYGLTGRPFQLTPDAAFYFESLTHRKALSYLGCTRPSSWAPTT